MKRAILSLITIILLLSICINTYAECDTFNRTGKHMNVPYTSDVHTPQGHQCGYICQDCELITVTGYTTL